VPAVVGVLEVPGVPEVPGMPEVLASFPTRLHQTV